jgi:hypothetical protein
MQAFGESGALTMGQEKSRTSHEVVIISNTLPNADGHGFVETFSPLGDVKREERCAGQSEPAERCDLD